MVDMYYKVKLNPVVTIGVAELTWECAKKVFEEPVMNILFGNKQAELIKISQKQFEDAVAKGDFELVRGEKRL